MLYWYYVFHQWPNFLSISDEQRIEDMIFFKVICRKKFKLSSVYSIHSSTMSRSRTLVYPHLSDTRVSSWTPAFVFSSGSVSRTLNALKKKIWQEWCYESSNDMSSNTMQFSCGHLERQLSTCFLFQTQMSSWENSKPHGETSCPYSH